MKKILVLLTLFLCLSGCIPGLSTYTFEDTTISFDYPSSQYVTSILERLDAVFIYENDLSNRTFYKGENYPFINRIYLEEGKSLEESIDQYSPKGATSKTVDYGNKEYIELSYHSSHGVTSDSMTKFKAAIYLTEYEEGVVRIEWGGNPYSLLQRQKDRKTLRIILESLDT